MFAHGSSVASANDAVRNVTREVTAQGAFALAETAFLEGGQPDLPEAVRRLVARGATQILVVPYFLTLGIHLQRDLPQIIEGILANYPHLDIQVTEPLDGHPALARIVVERASKAIECYLTKYLTVQS
ncbi:MAG: CbiX/SirB N-terminal domain-containing protein [Candidatus Solibacter usitatus]|nr:CbiX/SirB N-terminal domain-containing protein [Candidatus Solibacter usitatus]